MTHDSPAYQKLRMRVLEANQRLVELGLVSKEEEMLTFGNVSALDESRSIMAIKPSGMPYASMQEQDIVILNRKGELVWGDRQPSTDALTHLALYNGFGEREYRLGAIVHTHSPYATAFAQAGKPVVPLGTTHADFFNGTIPVIPVLKEIQVNTDYEQYTGEAIVNTFFKKNIHPTQIPGCLVRHHGPFAWGGDLGEALRNARALESIAQLNALTLQIHPRCSELPAYMCDKHFWRKHGKHAYYGQQNKV